MGHSDATLGLPAPAVQELLAELIMVRRREAILEYQPLLIKMCRFFGQEGEADELNHFMTAPVTIRKLPCLILVSATPGSPSFSGYAGAAILYEYQVSALRLRLYATTDWTGRRNVFGAPEDRARIAALACRALLEQGAQVVYAAFHLPVLTACAEETLDAVFGAMSPAAGHGMWARLGRNFPLYLPLKSTFDATLAGIGQRTRSNMRYYRRRVEAKLGATFTPDVKISCEEFLELNRISAFAVSDEEAAQRYDAMRTYRNPFLLGMRDAEGRWLSVIFGWRHLEAVELKWQVNRADLPEYSLATVMRGYLIEYAVGHGCKRLYIEGGTKQALQLSFVSESAYGLILRRDSLYARFVQRAAKLFFHHSAAMRKLLAETPELEWKRW